MNNERNHLNPHNIDPSRIDPAHLLPDAGKMDRVDRAPGFDSVRPGQDGEWTHGQGGGICGWTPGGGGNEFVESPSPAKLGQTKGA